MQMKPAVVVGSINMDLVVRAEHIPVVGETVLGKDFQVHPGGKGANQAVAIARLGYPVHLIGRLGNDAFGAQLRLQIEDTGVRTSGVMITEGASGLALIVVSAKGENSIVVAPGANAALTPEDLNGCVELIRSAGMVLAQLEVPLDTTEHLARMCIREGVPLMLDPAPAGELSPELLRAVSWFTPNESEAAFFVAGCDAGVTPTEIAYALRARGVRSVALKLGARGVFVQHGEGEVLVDAFRVEAVDTTAAGDCFNGAFAVALLEGNTPAESAQFGAAAAALSVMRRGAQTSMPKRPEVESFLRSVKQEGGEKEH